MKQVGYYHVFPFQEIEQGSSVIIWGMGEVGQHYLKQVFQTGYCNVEYAVDRDWHSYKDSFIQVMPPYAVRRSPSEVRIVIANGNAKAVGEIRQQLQDWGIPDDRIVWNDIVIGESMVVSDQTTQQAPKVKRIGFYHIFPFHRVEKGETLLIWGMGEVGRHYTQQLQKTGYAQVEYAVDSKWQRLKDAPVEIKAPGQIAISKDIRVVVANGSGQAAEAIKAQLKSMGVEEKRILWEDMIVEGELVVQENAQQQKAGTPYLYGSESTISNRRNPIYEVIDLLEDHDVVSFAIFNTVILPKFDKSDSTSLFEIIGNRIGCSDFAQIRLMAEDEVRQNSPYPEITLEEIYDVIGRKIGIDPQQGCKMEVDAICQFYRANPYMLEIFNMVKASGKSVIFVEDTYLKKEYLQRILSSCGYEGDYQIFSSCDLSARKEDGDMYRLIRNAMGKKLRYIHLGQNAPVDRDEAKKWDFDGKYFYGVHEKGNHFRAEDMFCMAGSAYRQLVNCKLHEDNKVYSVPFEYGFIYGGMLLLGFALWMREEVTVQDINKVIYLDDDSEVVQKVYSLLNESMEIKKLAWSEEVGIRLAASMDRHGFLEKMLRNVKWSEYCVTISEYLISINAEMLIRKLPEYHLSEFHEISNHNTALVEKILVDNWAELMAVYDNEGQIAKKYIQSVIGDSKKISLVDITGYGEKAVCLARLMHKWKLDCEINVMTIGSTRINNTHVAGNNKIKVSAYAFSRNYQREIEETHLVGKSSKQYNFAFSLMFKSTIPKLVSFYEENGRINFKYMVNGNEDRKNRCEIDKGLLSFCEDYLHWFGGCDELMRISPVDAYAPFGFVASTKEYFDNNFPNTMGECNYIEI